MRAKTGEHCADRIAVAHDNAVDSAHLARLRRDAQSPRGTDKRERSLRSRAGDLQRGRTARLGKRAVREKRAAPGRLAVAHSPRDDRRRKTANRTSACIDDPGLPGEGIATLDDADEVARPLSESGLLHHGDVASVPVDLEQVLLQPARRGARVEFSLDDDVARNQVETAGEAQDARHFGLATARLGDLNPAELVLHRRCHCHNGPSCHLPSTEPNATASLPGSCSPLRAPPG